jgi:hypothetical protein
VQHPHLLLALCLLFLSGNARARARARARASAILPTFVMFGRQAGLTEVFGAIEGVPERAKRGAASLVSPSSVRGVAFLRGVAQRRKHFRFAHIILSPSGHETRLIRVVRAAVAHQLFILLIWSLLWIFAFWHRSVPHQGFTIKLCWEGPLQKATLRAFCHITSIIFFNVSSTPRYPGEVISAHSKKCEKSKPIENGRCIFAPSERERTDPRTRFRGSVGVYKRFLEHGSLPCSCSFPFPSALIHSSPTNHKYIKYDSPKKQ